MSELHFPRNVGSFQEEAILPKTKTQENREKISLIRAVEEGANLIKLSEVVDRVLQDPESLSKQATKALFRTLKIPQTYATNVPEKLRRDMLVNGLSRLEIEEQKSDVFIFEKDQHVHLLTPYGFSSLATTLEGFMETGTLADFQGNPLDDMIRVFVRTSQDLNVDPDSPLYGMYGFRTSLTGTTTSSAETGLFRQVCTNGLTRKEKDAPDLAIHLKPGLMSAERVSILVGAMEGAAKASEEYFVKRVQDLQQKKVVDPIKLLSEAVENGLLTKSLGVQAGGVIAALANSEGDAELPSRVETGWDLVNVLTYTARSQGTRARAISENKILRFADKFLTN